MSKRITEREVAMPRVNPMAIATLIIMGIVLLVITLTHGDPWFGVGMLVICWGFAAFLQFGSRVSDTVALISDDVQDERNVQIHQRAALYTLNIVGFVIVSAFIVDIARGGTGSPYTWLALISAATYMSLPILTL